MNKMVDIVREHLLSILASSARYDGRKFDEYRQVKVEYGISKSAEGSARVMIGDTDVIAGVKLEVGKPFPDTPSEGSIMVNVELRPFSNPEFEAGPPGTKAIELARVVDRFVREGKAVDFKKLCIREGELVWIVVIDIYPVNDSGNLFDAAAIAAIAALQDTKFPKLDEKDKIDYKESNSKKLPLRALPLSFTVVKIGGYLLVDPSFEEESFIDARLTVGILEDGVLCSMQKGEDCALDVDDVEKMIDIAVKKNKELRKVLMK